MLKILSPNNKSANKNITYIEVIGKGGFGTVWKCKLEDGTLCAAKIINKLNLKADDIQLLNTEIKVWTSLSHTNIVKLLDVKHDKNLILISELMEETLYDVHKRMRRLGAKPRIITIANNVIQLSEAMVYVHSLNILHRDIKSENVLKTFDNVMKLSDFGLSRYTSSSIMTAETGSYRWMAPEVFRHEQYDKSCDVYSFAMLMYEMITLCIPFCNTFSPIEVAFDVAKFNRRPQLPEISHEFCDLICDCWHHSPSLRPTFENILSRIRVIRAKKESFGSLEMTFKNVTKAEKYTLSSF